MGRSQSDKEKTYRRILEIAATNFREQGVHAAGLASLMKAAGLTHGGFYRHFASRDQLVREAVAYALAQGDLAVQRSATPDGQPDLSALIEAYLSTAHRDSPGAGCAMVALAADAARSSEEVRSAFAGQVEKTLALLASLLPPTTPVEQRMRAQAMLATLVGAVTLARAVGSGALSEEILKASAAALLPDSEAILRN